MKKLLLILTAWVFRKPVKRPIETVPERAVRYTREAEEDITRWLKMS